MIRNRFSAAARRRCLSGSTRSIPSGLISSLRCAAVGDTTISTPSGASTRSISLVLRGPNTDSTVLAEPLVRGSRCQASAPTAAALRCVRAERRRAGADRSRQSPISVRQAIEQGAQVVAGAAGHVDGDALNRSRVVSRGDHRHLLGDRSEVAMGQEVFTRPNHRAGVRAAVARAADSQVQVALPRKVEGVPAPDRRSGDHSGAAVAHTSGSAGMRARRRSRVASRPGPGNSRVADRNVRGHGDVPSGPKERPCGGDTSRQRSRMKARVGGRPAYAAGGVAPLRRCAGASSAQIP